MHVTVCEGLKGTLENICEAVKLRFICCALNVLTRDLLAIKCALVGNVQLPKKDVLKLI